MDILDITAAVNDGRVRITDHAEEAAVDDHLPWDDIFYSVDEGEIIENYSSDKPYPSCLICGRDIEGDLIHSVWAYNPDNQWAVVVTVYRPTPELWIDGQIRRKMP